MMMPCSRNRHSGTSSHSVTNEILKHTLPSQRQHESGTDSNKHTPEWTKFRQCSRLAIPIEGAAPRDVQRNSVSAHSTVSIQVIGTLYLKSITPAVYPVSQRCSFSVDEYSSGRSHFVRMSAYGRRARRLKALSSAAT